MTLWTRRKFYRNPIHWARYRLYCGTIRQTELHQLVRSTFLHKGIFGYTSTAEMSLAVSTNYSIIKWASVIYHKRAESGFIITNKHILPRKSTTVQVNITSYSASTHTLFLFPLINVKFSLNLYGQRMVIGRETFITLENVPHVRKIHITFVRYTYTLRSVERINKEYSG